MNVNTKPKKRLDDQRTWVDETAKCHGISRWARGRPGESLVVVSFKGIRVLDLDGWVLDTTRVS